VFPGLRAPTPPPQPGFNFNPGTPSPAGWLPEWLAQIMPSGQDLKQGVAETLGAPVDILGYMAHRAGLAVPGGEAPREWTPSVQGTPTWIPGEGVPLSSRNIRGMLDNPPPLDAFLQAMRRYGKF
jgi:hypothetical protein